MRALGSGVQIALFPVLGQSTLAHPGFLRSGPQDSTSRFRAALPPQHHTSDLDTDHLDERGMGVPVFAPRLKGGNGWTSSAS
ncbi:hypothetical protein C8263_14095 [Deinococcus arcticus]|uniref:Uncharacterized protein n=1 Tax=Deinococcus arcticus TaxID=2136176 RepID=A0A2T3W5Q7_9DEIO|nr:hypothetical protein C8263_14095 [Deinococcus arcticus]